MDGLPKFETFSYQVNPFGLMEDFKVENFVPKSDSNSESQIEEEDKKVQKRKIARKLLRPREGSILK